MIPYEPKSWLKLTLHVRGTVIPRLLGRVGCLLLLTVVALAVKHSLPDPSKVFNGFKPLGHTLIGVAIGLLIVFRTNASYDRYWEGRKLWGGIINTSRNLVRGTVAHVHDARELANLVSAYALALKQHLRNDKNLSEIEELISPELFQRASATANPPSIIALAMSRWIQHHQSHGRLDAITAQGLESQVRLLLDGQGGCERILRTPIPFAYAVHIKQLVMLYLVTLPFVLVAEMEWVALPLVGVISFGLLGIEEAGVEIEDPFGDDPNDLPVEAMCATIGRDVLALVESPAH
jgi:putative membrane protein